MAKRKKTREQKILTEIQRRQQLTSQSKHNLVASISSVKTNDKILNHTTKKQLSDHNSVTLTPYNLIHDLRKTLVVTLIIIIAQLILYFYFL